MNKRRFNGNLATWTKAVLSPISRLMTRVGLGGPIEAIRPPNYLGLCLTPKRLLNYYARKFQRQMGHLRLFGYPSLLVLEATNACNLRCPYCPTGAGQVGRERSMMPLPLYKKVLDELGDYLLYMEFCNWGEPLLHRRLPEMISMASKRGVSTLISTHFSLPMNASQSEELVASGLAVLGVSLDGARQESYEKYRVGGDIETVLRNIRLVNEAKRKLNATLPKVIWSFHVFEWNRHEIELAKSMARDLEIEISITKGWVSGEEWDSEGEFGYGIAESSHVGIPAHRCKFLWMEAVIHNDGGVAPCDGAFYSEDDNGSVVDRPFKEVWNNERFQEARRLYQSRGTSTDHDLICYNCPATLNFQQYQQHRKSGEPTASFRPTLGVSAGFNYFFNRRPQKRGDIRVKDAIALQKTSAPARRDEA